MTGIIIFTFLRVFWSLVALTDVLFVTARMMNYASCQSPTLTPKSQGSAVMEPCEIPGAIPKLWGLRHVFLITIIGSMQVSYTIKM